MKALKYIRRKSVRFNFPLNSFWLLLLGLPLIACGGEKVTLSSPVEGIQVTGRGSAFGNPDVAILNLGVSTERSSVNEAREEAASAMGRVIDALKANGVAEKEIQTQQFSIQPQYDWVDNRQTLRGFRVTNLVSVKVRVLEQIGKVIDDVAEAAGDIVQVQGIQFTIDDPKDLQADARVEAMKDAQAKAQTLAEEGGVKLGKPVSISEVVGGSQPIPFAERAADAGTPIESGQLEITVTVTVIYDID